MVRRPLLGLEGGVVDSVASVPTNNKRPGVRPLKMPTRMPLVWTTHVVLSVFETMSPALRASCEAAASMSARVTWYRPPTRSPVIRTACPTSSDARQVAGSLAGSEIVGSAVLTTDYLPTRNTSELARWNRRVRLMLGISCP